MFKKSEKHSRNELPSDFCAEEYLKLNPDVAAAKDDPRKHYLIHGMRGGTPL